MTLLEIYRQRRIGLERFVRRMLGNADEAADVAQEAFLRVYAAELGHQTPISEALLYTAARNLALTELRKRTSRATDSMADMSELSIEASGSDPEAIASNRQMIAAVELAMTRMPPRCLEVFRMRKIDDLSHADISKRLGISTKSVERHITHALQICHEALTKDCSQIVRAESRAGSISK
jgi:RNA polymerase sigma factor (sigma-70 family)